MTASKLARPRAVKLPNKSSKRMKNASGSRIIFSRLFRSLAGQTDRETIALIALVSLLVLCLWMGGSSLRAAPGWATVLGAGSVACGVGIATIKKSDFTRHRGVIILLLLGCCLAAVQLIPLSPEMWHNFPGRGLIRQIDEAADLQGQWRPLSLVPALTAHAALQLVLALGAALLAAQLGPERQRLLGWLVFVMIVISGLFGVMQTQNPELINILGYRNGNQPVGSGFFANRNHHGLVLASALPLFAALVRPEPNQPWRLASLIAAALVLFPLVLVNGSRSGLLLFFIGAILVYLCLIWIGLFRSSRTKVRRRFAFLATLIILCATFGAILLIGLDTDRAVAFSRLLMDDRNQDMRSVFNREGWKIAWLYWPLGTGLGTFMVIYSVHEKVENLTFEIPNQAHNDWLDILITAGLPGIALMFSAVVFYFLLLKKIWKARHQAMQRRHSCNFTLQHTGVIVIFLFAVASLVDYPGRVPWISAFAAVCFVWASASAHPPETGRTEALVGTSE